VIDLFLAIEKQMTDR